MNPPASLLRLVTAMLLSSCAPLDAQTHVWLAPGPATPPADWFETAHWDTGAVPNAPDATAVLTAYPLGQLAGPLAPVTTNPGTAPALIGAGTVDLAELRWQLAGGSTQTGSDVQIGTFQATPVFSSSAATLRLHGAGLTVGRTVPAGFLPASVRVVNGSLEFLEGSSSGPLQLVTGPIITSGANAVPRLTFRDTSSAGTSVISNGGLLTFEDDASAAQSQITLSSAGTDGGASLTFGDRARAGAATIQILAHGRVDFTGESSAEDAQIVASGDVPQGRTRELAFRDTASAGSARINAAIPVRFTDSASAGAAQITVASEGSLEFGGSATAGSARLTSVAARITFADNGSAGSSAITLDGEARPSRLEFRDQASTGTASVVFAANATLDLSGLFENGVSDGTGRSSVFMLNETVVANDAVERSLGSLLVQPGVNEARIRLGSNRLIVGENDASIAALPRLMDGGTSFSADGRHLGGGGLTKRGTGIVQVARLDNDYTGETRVEGGELRLLGGNVSATRVAEGAILSGSGILLHLENAGTVSPGSATVLDPSGATGPGNPIGSLHVFGDFVARSGGAAPSNLRIDVGASGSDQLVVSGGAALGGRLQLVRVGNYTPVGDQRLAFLTAASVSGQFDEVINPFVDTPLMRSRIVPFVTGVALEFDQQSIAGLGANPAAVALGAHLDTVLAGATADQRALIAGLNTQTSAAAVARSLDALAPDRYGAVPAFAFLSVLSQSAARERVVSGAGREGFALEFAGRHVRAELDAADGLPAAQATSSGGMVAARWQRERFAGALTLAQEKSTMDLDDQGSRAEIEGVIPAVTFRLNGDRWFVGADAAFVRDDLDLRRRIAGTGFDQPATATTSGVRTDLAVSAGAQTAVGTVCLSPHLALVASRWRVDPFVETAAGGAAVAVQDWSVRSLRLRAGIDLAFHAPHCAPQGRFVPKLAAAWWHELEDNGAFRAGLAGSGQNYLAPGRAPARDLVQVQAGFDWRLGPRAMISASVGGAWGDRSQVRSELNAAVRWHF